MNEVGLRIFEDCARAVIAFDADRERSDLTTHLDVFGAVADEDSLFWLDPKLAESALERRGVRFFLFRIFETHHHCKKVRESVVLELA